VATAAELAFGRKTIEQEFDKLATVSRNTGTTDDEYGGEEEDWDDLPGLVKCRLSAIHSTRGGVEISESEATKGKRQYLITMPWNADVRRQDKLRINGFEYEVFSINNDESDRFSLNAMAVRLD
jgi:hypothetical protein